MNKTQRARRWGIWLALLIGVMGLALIGRAAAQEEAPPPGSIKDVPEGYMVIEGDILVPTDFYDQVGRGTWATNLWPNGVVPFIFDSNVEEPKRAQMLAAMQEWENVANVDFRPRTNEISYVRIRDSEFNRSAVGMQIGEQDIEILNWNFRFIMAHELAHTLGIWHEQSRPDRDRYIQINWDNIDDGEEHNFDRHDSAGLYPKQAYGLPDAQTYDFDSVMHYGQFDFSSNGQRTITVKPPNESWQSRIGQYDHLSRLDILTVSSLYPESNWRFLDRTYTGGESGSFLRPYRSLTAAVNNTPTGGRLLIQPGNYSAAGTYSRPMLLTAPLGRVSLGQ